jgi:hypothetical protein
MNEVYASAGPRNGLIRRRVVALKACVWELSEA